MPDLPVISGKKAIKVFFKSVDDFIEAYKNK